MYQVGIDIGSSAAKTVVLRDGEIWKTMEMATGFSSRKTADEIYEWLEKEQVAGEGTRYGATGYGRVSVPYADKVITEITCHGKGAWKLFGKDGVVIDIGGQDTKGIVLKSGRVMKFVMNDKCAAGTGRFLDVIAKVLEINLSDLEVLDEKSKEDITISSTCTVFAESEVISQLAKGTKYEDIVKGIHASIASRVGSLAKRVGIKDQVVMTGGVALNHGMIRALEKNIGFKIYTSEYCQLNGAIGAALFAYQKCLNAEK